MANNNIFKKHLSVFLKSKSDKLSIQRRSDCYYICDGYTLLKLPAGFYDLCARPISPVFLALENGQCAVRRQREPLPEIVSDNYDLSSIFDKTEATIPAEVTNLFYLCDDRKMCRYVNCGANRIRVYNDSYISAILEYADPGKLFATKDRFPVLKWEEPAAEMGCIAMPVNSPAALDALKVNANRA